MMKKLYPVLLFIGLLTLGGCANSTSSENELSSLSSENETSTTIQTTTLITKENAKDVSSFDNTPQAVVMFFYASRIRGDKEWEKVCLPENERSDKMKRKLEEYKTWTILEYKFVSVKEKSDDKCFVSLWMKISVDGEVDEGEDEATVELIDGKWIITSIPT